MWVDWALLSATEQANRRHLLEGKPSKRTRRLKGTESVSQADTKRVKRLLGRA